MVMTNLVHALKGGDTSRTFKKSKIFLLLKSIEKLFKNIIPTFYWSTPNTFMTRKLNGTYFFMYKNFEARFLETNFCYPAVKIASKLFNRFT